MGPTQTLASFAAEVNYQTLPAPVKAKMVGLTLDYFRVASIGERLPWSTWARQYTLQNAGMGTAPLLFSKQQLDPASAAFLNSVYAGSIDADDVHVGAMLHPGCLVFSAALAVGASRNMNGAQVMAAVVAGYEVMIRIALGIQPSHFKRGFQSTATCGVFGAAVAAASLIFNGPDRATRIAQTIGLAASTCGGLTQFYHSESTVKRLHAAQAASAGVRAALMVEAGFSGPTDILEGQDGFVRAYADAVDFSLMTEGLGTLYHCTEVAIKPHACSARVLSAVEAASDLCRQHNIDANSITAITLGIPKVIQGRLTSNQPNDLQAAQMSAPFSVALAICKGGPKGFSLNIDDFENNLEAPLVRHLTRMVDCVLDDEVEKTSSTESVSARVTLTLATGVRHAALVLAPMGSVSRPYALEDHLVSAERQLAQRYQAPKVTAFLDLAQRLSALGQVRDLATFLD